MRGSFQAELEFRTRSRELALAWGKGRAGYVLDSLAKEEPSRAALLATFIYEVLASWDPCDCRLPSGFRQALLLRSEGLLTTEEYRELESAYRRRFGKRPPPTDLDSAPAMMEGGRRICEALRRGEPITSPGRGSSVMFLRGRAAARRPASRR